MDKTNNLIYVATDHQLMDETYYRRLWLAVRNIDIPRRDWLDVLANTFRDYEGELLWETGHSYDLPDIDDTFNNDIDMRWFGYFVRANDTGLEPASRTFKLERLRILDLYFKIAHPNMAELIAK